MEAPPVGLRPPRSGLGFVGELCRHERKRSPCLRQREAGPLTAATAGACWSSTRAWGQGIVGRTSESNCAYGNALHLSPSSFGRELGHCGLAAGLADGTISSSTSLRHHRCGPPSPVREAADAQGTLALQTGRNERNECVRDGSVRLVGRAATNTNRWISRVCSRRPKPGGPDASATEGACWRSSTSTATAS